MISYSQKFKTWNIKEKKWETDIALDQTGHFYILHEDILYPTTDSYKFLFEDITKSENYVFLFSTLLTDRHNIEELYEADILRHYSAGDICEDDFCISRLDNRLVMLSMYKPRILELTKDNLSQYEKIGNMYSNLELLN